MELLRYARLVVRRFDEAEDLLQAVLLAAVEAGRADLASVENQRWLKGALRKRAAFDARSAIRRRRRDSIALPEPYETDSLETFPAQFITTLPPALRITALLIFTGHTKSEIAWLLGINDAALRQRITAIRKRCRNWGIERPAEYAGLTGSLPYGRMRQALLRPVRSKGVLLGSHDPDGNLFVVGSQNHAARQQQGRATRDKEQNNVCQK